MVELGQTPINKAKLSERVVSANYERKREIYLSSLVVNHHIVRLHVSVHDAL